MTENFDSLFPTVNTVTGQGIIRLRAEDFMVIEHHKINFTGVGEHLWFKVQKIHSNTAWVATQLASACKVPARQVGFAGLKDRHAITQQWFSVQLPKISELKEISANLPEEITIMEHHWHQSKLKTGFLTFNEFKLVIRNFQGDRSQVENNIAAIKVNGVPNYFGQQRFGKNMGNIQLAQDWFNGKTRVNNKKLKGLLISTARSHIFNLIVAKRIGQQRWNVPMPGDIVQLDNSHSWFAASDATDQELSERLSSFDLHLTAAMWGEDQVQSTAQCADLETSIAKQFPIYKKGFEKFKLKQDRRAMRIYPKNLSYQWCEQDLQIKFELTPGAYATGVLKEILKVYE